MGGYDLFWGDLFWGDTYFGGTLMLAVTDADFCMLYLPLHGDAVYVSWLHTTSVFGLFCTSQFALQLAWWLLIRLSTGHHAYALTSSSSVYIRPRWLPIGVLQALRPHHLIIYASALIALALGAIQPSSYPVRCFFAAAISIYHLVESSASSRHGEFPLLYVSWAAWLLPDAWAHAASLGVMVHFVSSSGAAKIIVGGSSWMSPHTLRTYLELFLPSKASPPLSRLVNTEISTRDWMTQLLALVTFTLECVLIPACLLLPPPYRLLGACAMMGMHFCIGLAMSLKVGLLFLTTLPCYHLGFSCDAPVGSGPWKLAAAIGVLPSAMSLVAGKLLLHEEWPFTPFSFFMFEGTAAKRIASDLMTEETRLVLATSESPATHAELVGARVMPHILLRLAELTGDDGAAAAQGAEAVAVHDGVLRVISFTTAHAGLASLLTEGGAGTSLASTDESSSSNKLGVMPSVVSHVTAWLERDRRLIESATGLPLTRAYFVRVSRERGRERVEEVLCGDELSV